MDDAVGMGVFQSCTHLAGDGENIVQSFRALFMQRWTLHQLHHNGG